MNLADPEEFKQRYREIEARVESGQELWRSAMARVVLLAIQHGIERARDRPASRLGTSPTRKETKVDLTNEERDAETIRIARERGDTRCDWQILAYPDPNCIWSGTGDPSADVDWAGGR